MKGTQHMDIYMPQYVFATSEKPLVKPARLYIKKCTHCDLMYFGRTVRDDVVKYVGSGKRWKNHLEKHNVKTPETIWISEWFSDESIIKYSIAFSRANRIVENEEWANLIEEDGIGHGGAGFLRGSLAAKNRGAQISKTRNDITWKETVGNKTAKMLSEMRSGTEWWEKVGKEAFDRMKKTISSEEWKSTTGSIKSEKLSNIQNDPLWKETKGKEKSLKVSRTTNNAEWKATVGSEKTRKQIETKQSIEWKETKGKERSAKISSLYKDPDWLSTKGVEMRAKISKVKNDPQWVRDNTMECPHCGKNCLAPNYKRWHGDNCSKKTT